MKRYTVFFNDQLVGEYEDDQEGAWTISLSSGSVIYCAGSGEWLVFTSGSFLNQSPETINPIYRTWILTL